MADEKKGVTVAVSHTTTDDFYEDGRDVRVTEGHLYVTRGVARTPSPDGVAVYAPGSWRYASVSR